jgi:hypothetical protein
MAGSSDHIKTFRLFGLSQNSDYELAEEEKRHLRGCQECQRVLAVLSRQFRKQKSADDKPAKTQ